MYVLESVSILVFLGEYMQNQNTDQLKSSVPCPERLPSCIGLPDSRNALPGKKWMSDYVMCYRNRTLMVYHCDRGYYFNPYRRTCVKVIDTGKYLLFIVSPSVSFLSIHPSQKCVCTTSPSF